MRLHVALWAAVATCVLVFACFALLGNTRDTSTMCTAVATAEPVAGSRVRWHTNELKTMSRYGSRSDEAAVYLPGGQPPSTSASARVSDVVPQRHDSDLPASTSASALVSDMVPQRHDSDLPKVLHCTDEEMLLPVPLPRDGVRRTFGGTPFMSHTTVRSVSSHSACNLYEAGDFNSTVITKDNAATVPRGAILHLCKTTTWTFFKQIWPRINQPVRIIYHDCDPPIPGTLMTKAMLLDVLSSAKLEHFFIQNIGIRTSELPPHLSAKVTAIPIGLARADRVTPCMHHTMAFMYTKYGLWNVPDVFSAMKRWKTDEWIAMIDFTGKNEQQRQNVIDRLCKRDTQWVFCRPYARDGEIQLELYEMRGKSKFVISPEGAGMDCFRTWEALLVGSYPIVLNSTIEEVFEGLPVLIVNSWQEVTLELLQATYERFSTVKHWPGYDKMYAEYWADVFSGTPSIVQSPSASEGGCFENVMDLGGGEVPPVEPIIYFGIPKTGTSTLHMLLCRSIASAVGDLAIFDEVDLSRIHRIHQLGKPEVLAVEHPVQKILPQFTHISYGMYDKKGNMEQRVNEFVSTHRDRKIMFSLRRLEKTFASRWFQPNSIATYKPSQVMINIRNYVSTINAMHERKASASDGERILLVYYDDVNSDCVGEVMKILRFAGFCEYISRDIIESVCAEDLMNAAVAKVVKHDTFAEKVPESIRREAWEHICSELHRDVFHRLYSDEELNKDTFGLSDIACP